ncbi:MAG: hypothetical protein ABJB17_01720 [Burkholderiales bacterium]
MRRLDPVLLLLLACSLLLAAALATLWFDPVTLQLRNTHWQPPAAREPDFAAMAPLLASRVPPDASAFAATLQRPLFSPNRRPPVPLPPPAPVKPPPVPVVNEKPPPDPLAEVKILGMYMGATRSGIIAMVDGKPRRAQLNDQIADWTITSIGDHDVTFSQAGIKRVLPLEVKRTGRGAGGAQPPALPAGNLPLPPKPAPTAQSAPPADPFVIGGRQSRSPAAVLGAPPQVRP